MGDDSNLHFASQCIFFEFLVTGHKKRRGEGGMHRFLVAVYCDPDDDVKAAKECKHWRQSQMRRSIFNTKTGINLERKNYKCLLKSEYSTLQIGINTSLCLLKFSNYSKAPS